jgi:hypothetical protein
MPKYRVAIGQKRIEVPINCYPGHYLTPTTETKFLIEFSINDRIMRIVNENRVSFRNSYL